MSAHDRNRAALSEQILGGFEQSLWHSERDRPLSQHLIDAYRHHDPRAADSDDPLHRYCTEHDVAWVNMDGYFSACPKCFEREWKTWQGKK